jgi:LmbE family N-acetylglucosaminyl deacetylase
VKTLEHLEHLEHIEHLIQVSALALLLAAAPLPAQQPSTPAPARTILAIGAHAGDMELTAGAVLLKQRQLGDRIVLLHLSLGERGNPKLAAAAYGNQKRREAEAAARVLGAELLIGPFRDGEVPTNEDARRYVAEVIRQMRPSLVITHWRESIHRDHAATHAIVVDAVLLAAIDAGKSGEPPHRGTRVWYAENWEDTQEFQPYLYVDVGDQMAKWRELVTSYEFVRGGISSFAYLDYYTSLATVRGAEARRRQAVAFDIDPLGKKRVLDSVP